MRTKIQTYALPVALAVALGGASTGWSQVWTENFDSYTNGQVLDNVNGWAGYDNVGIFAGVVSNAQSFSSPNSLFISSQQDAVRTFAGITTGTYTMTHRVYIPAGLTGVTSFLLLSQYNAPGAKTFVSEDSMDLDFDEIVDLYTGNFLPIARNTWIPYEIVMDFDNRVRITRFGDQVLSVTSLETVLGAPNGLAAINVWGNTVAPGGQGVFYDNFQLSEGGDNPYQRNYQTPWSSGAPWGGFLAQNATTSLETGDTITLSGTNRIVDHVGVVMVGSTLVSSALYITDVTLRFHNVDQNGLPTTLIHQQTTTLTYPAGFYTFHGIEVPGVEVPSTFAITLQLQRGTGSNTGATGMAFNETATAGSSDPTFFIQRNASDIWQTVAFGPPNQNRNNMIAYVLAREATGGPGSSLLWEGPNSGPLPRLLVMWRTENAQVVLPTVVIDVAPPTWQVRSFGDINNNNSTELVWQNTDPGFSIPGLVAFWSLDNNGVPLPAGTGGAPPSFDWQIRAVADIDGNGTLDFVWYNVNTQGVAVWLRNSSGDVIGTPFVGTAPSTWDLRGAGELTGTNNQIVFQDAASNAIAYWTVDATGTLVGSVVVGFAPNSDWQTRGIADLNGPSIVFVNTATNLVAYWNIAPDGSVSGTGVLEQGPAGWNLLGTGRF
jgi:hypothetical protein